MAMKLWRVRAGPTAYAQLQDQGWDWNHFDVLLGASGGPKWLILAALDRAFCGWLRPQRPLHLLGSSSGAWRFTAYLQPEPVRALQRLEEAYIGANWTPTQNLRQAGEQARQILRAYLEDLEVTRHPWFRLHVVTSRVRGLVASDWLPLQFVGLLHLAVLAGLGRRRWLGRELNRCLFSDPRTPLPSSFEDIATQVCELHRDNLFLSLQASGSIPLLLPRHRSPAGWLRDGGLVDYHFDSLELRPDGLILLPHFAPELKLGWLERFGPRTQANPAVWDRMVLLAPTPEWIQSLPGGKIPDRDDAGPLNETQRIQRWTECVRRGEQLVEACQPGMLMDSLELWQA